MGRRRKPKPPDLDFLEENSLPRYVSLDFMCDKYELSKAQCKEMARASGAFYEIRRASLIDRIAFEDVYKGQLRERKRQQKVELVKEQLKSYEPVTKEYMRYQEAADYFSMSELLLTAVIGYIYYFFPKKDRTIRSIFSLIEEANIEE